MRSDEFCNVEQDSQITDFINYLYRPEEETLADPRYQLISVSDKDILSTVWKFTTKFDGKTPVGFSQWINRQELDLLSSEPKRKIAKTGNEIRLRSRKLNVLNDTYHVSVAENVLNVLPCHQAKINELKQEGFKIIGYCRKSLASSKNRVSCLQRMINILYKRSLVDKVFVSPQSSAKQQFAKRDLSDDDVLPQLEDVHGSTKDFLKYLKSNDKICVVAIDYAGFTTNMSDLRDLLR
ncbi:hypothetical protein G6F42_019743 [Rhizopus arrhizus]|nr:hypothetical protein G6F42_019743 [Rhizopus arrhizus]